MIGHVAPEAAAGGTIALVRDGDPISINVDTRSITLEVPADELAKRKAAWKAPAPKYTTGVFNKYVKLVGSASEGAVTGG
jgi:dihydroxy-acid dehydratase